jgi:hypothetical protein
MSSRKHPPSKHHCYALADLVPLVEQLGHKNSEKNWENDEHAYAYSVEKTVTGPCVTIHLDKKTKWLTVSRKP